MKDYSRHHLIPKSRDWSWHKDNLIFIHNTKHKALHLLYGNNTPLEIQRVMLETYKKTLSPDTYHIVDEALKKVEWIMESYNPNCYYASEYPR